MAESTVALGFAELMAETAQACGYGHYADQSEGLTADQEEEAQIYLDEAYRTFLLAYEWSFTRPIGTSVLWGTTTATTTMSVGGTGNKTITASAATFYPTMIGHTIVSTNASYVIDGYTSSTVVTVTTDASADDAEAFQITADGTYRMPDDFGGLLTPVYFNTGDGQYVPLEQAGVAELLHLLQGSDSAARPTVCAVNPLAVSGTTGQRHDLYAWRIPDSAYTVKYQYWILPDALVATAYPYGGALHGETLKQACLATVERRKFSIVNGPAEQQFQKLLAVSMKRDQRGARAQTIGVLRNLRGTRVRRGYIGTYPTGITCEGVSYP